MVLICHPHEFVYIKTHKTASTSTEMALEPYCAPPGHKVIRPSRMLETEYGIVGSRFGEMEKKGKPGFYWNHMSARQIRLNLGARKFDGYSKVACVRNPYRMLLSKFFFRSTVAGARHALAPPRDLDDARTKFRAFLIVDPEDWSIDKNVGTDYELVHMDGKLVLDRFIRAENLREDIRDYLVEVGVADPKFELGHEWDNSAGWRGWKVMDFFDDPELVDRAQELEAWMFDLAGYSRDPRDA